MRQPNYIVQWVVAVLILAALACNLTSSNDNDSSGSGNSTGGSSVGNSSAVPTVTFVNPPTTATINVELQVPVRAEISQGSISSVALYVNDVNSRPVSQAFSTGTNTVNTTLRWTPLIPGQVTLIVRAVSANNVQSETQSIQLTISTTAAPTQVGGSGGGTSLTPIAPSGSTGPCRAQMQIQLRFRTVPDTSSSDTIIRTFNVNEEANIQGRLGDNSWFQVTDPQTGRVGWVAYNNGQYFTLLGSCVNVPVLNSPVVATATFAPTVTVAPTITSIPATLADIVALPITGSTQLQLAGGTTTGAYSLRIQNTGGSNTGAFRVLVVLPGGQEIVRNIANLAPGEIISVADGDQQNITFTVAGAYQISIFADSEAIVSESNEGNNFVAFTINVLAAP